MGIEEMGFGGRSDPITHDGNVARMGINGMGICWEYALLLEWECNGNLNDSSLRMYNKIYTGMGISLEYETDSNKNDVGGTK